MSPLYDRPFSMHTTAYGIVRDNEAIVIDNGTGVERVAGWIKAKKADQWCMLQTHFHADHIAGLTMNRLLFDKSIKMLGTFALDGRQMTDVWDKTFVRSNFPIRPEDYGIAMPQVTGSGVPQMSGITHIHLNHPGGCFGYRIASSRGDIVIATDHEAGGCYGEDQAYADFVDGAAVLVADMQFRQIEYDGLIGVGGGPGTSMKGRGHSTPALIRDVLDLCTHPPKKILITHHDRHRPGLDFRPFLFQAQRVLMDVCTDVSLLLDGEELSL